ncbi:hypothetical protein L7F22_018125 [Adiantum nelumboides]|nr:hypothetical protein [Adiantum nelumboides]
MQEASMSLQSMAVLLPYKDTPISNSQSPRLSKLSRLHGPRCTRRRLLVTNGAPQERESSKELRLNQQDMMAIEFGRLLGESKEKTISKVLRRKINPNSTYVDLEKEAKTGKGILKKGDFAVKVEQPTGASKNGSMSGPNVPRLASPPFRPGHILVNSSKNGAIADSQDLVENSLLRKPLSNQSSKAAQSIGSSASLAANNVKWSDSQHMKAVEDGNLVLDMLRRPSLEKPGSDIAVLPQQSVSASPSESPRPEIAEMPEDSEASKLGFQRLLDKAFNTTTADLSSPPVGKSIISTESTAQDASRPVDAAAALPNLASPPSRYRGSIGTLIQPTQRSEAISSAMKNAHPPNDTIDESVLQKPGIQISNTATSSPPVEQSILSTDSTAQDGSGPVDAAAALPNLAPPPLRHTDSTGTFIQPAESNTTTSSAIKNAHPANDTIDESVSRKPGIQTSNNGASLLPQSTEELYISQDNQSLMPPNVKDQSIPQLAAPPSRHQGSLGKFIQPWRAKNRDLVDNSVNEPFLRKPSFLEKAPVPMVSAPPTEASSTPRLTSKQTQSVNETLDNSLFLRPPNVASATKNDYKHGYQNDGLKQGAGEQTLQTSAGLDEAHSENSLQVGSGSSDESEVLKPALAIESSAQYDEHLTEPMISNASKDERETDVREGINLLSAVNESDSSQDTSPGSRVKRVKVAAWKNPARGLSSDSTKGLPSKKREDMLPGNLDSSIEFKTARAVEESVDTSLRLNSLVVDLSNVPSNAPGEASFVDEQREHGEELTTTIAVLESDQQSKSINTLRRPSQHADSHCSALAILEASSPKLHQAKEEEEKDWARVEALMKAKEQVEVKITGSNSAGLFILLGCLAGFLPSFELSPKRGLVDFISWAQQKGYAVSQKMGVKGGNNGSGTVSQNVVGDELIAATEGDLNDFKNMYREEVSKLMSSFVGERTKVIIKSLDKSRRKLRVSEKEADFGCQELLQKKANLMAELKLGEVVTCQVRSITPIGVFVEVDGVPALIHHSEVSWNTRADPASLLSIGEVIKAKVCRLDRTLQRINLSLKQMQPDPLKRTLESVVGDLDANSLMHEVDTNASLEVNWPEIGDLMTKLEKMDHISSVSKGRCLYSAAFAPSFQVLISTPQSNGYKLLARFENKIQEILVNTTLSRERMKECIRLCTFSEA